MNIDPIRAEFPILQRLVNGKPLCYLDNANTAQRPHCVIDAVNEYYCLHNANVARAVHTLGMEATERYEATRDKLAHFLNAPSRDEIIFTRGTTEGINLVAYSWGGKNLVEGDEVLLTQMEHHANIVPWQLACERVGAVIKVLPITDRGELRLDLLETMLTARTKLLAITHVSNALGTINPIQKIARIAHQNNTLVLVDGSQAAPHLKIDLRSLDVDFYAITGHKMFGPTGTGALWAKREHLDAMPPFMSGGEMIRKVSFSKTHFAEVPHKFEAGTPNIAGIIGLGAAVDYLQRIGFAAIETREQWLLSYADTALKKIPGLRIFGEASNKAAVISFAVDGIHAHDIATILDTEGVAVRSGHHCAHPLMDFYGVAATARISLAFFNTEAEIDCAVNAIEKARKMLS